MQIGEGRPGVTTPRVRLSTHPGAVQPAIVDGDRLSQSLIE